MGVEIGRVETFPHVVPDKAQVMKVVEEAVEVFSAWERWQMLPDDGLNGSYSACPEYRHLLDECADVVQATCNMLAALGVNDFTHMMRRCEERQRERGRFE